MTTGSGPGDRQREVYRIVGVVHLPPLPGSARGPAASEIGRVLDFARRDAAAWASGGADALIVENFGDVPFRKDLVGAETIAAMTLAVAAVVAESGLPVGVNVLRNDVEGAVGIAAATGGRFVRANVYAGATVTDQGIIEGRAEAVQALIRRLGATVAVWADVDVKHASPLAARPLGEQAEDAIHRGLAGAIIVSGKGTGQPTDIADLRQARTAVRDTPIYVGSGANAETLPGLLSVADGAIVGTAAKVDGILGNAVDRGRVRSLVAIAREISGR